VGKRCFKKPAKNLVIISQIDKVIGKKQKSVRLYKPSPYIAGNDAADGEET